MLILDVKVAVDDRDTVDRDRQASFIVVEGLLLTIRTRSARSGRLRTRSTGSTPLAVRPAQHLTDIRVRDLVLVRRALGVEV